MDRGNTANFYVTQVVNLFEAKKYMSCKRENLHIGVMFATHAGWLS